MATTVTYNHNDGRYAIDSFGDVAAEKNILTWMVSDTMSFPAAGSDNDNYRAPYWKNTSRHIQPNSLHLCGQNKLKRYRLKKKP